MGGHVSQNLALYSALVGAFLPLAIATVQHWKWPDHVRALVAFAICVAAAVGTALLQGDFTTKGIVGAILIVLTTARATYASIWQPTGVAAQVEAKTSRTSVEVVKTRRIARLGRTIEPFPSGARMGVAMTEIPKDGRGTVSLDAEPLTASGWNSELADSAKACVPHHEVGDPPAVIPEDADPLAFAAATK